MSYHKSEDYKITAVEYYLTQNNNQTKTCKIFKCSRRSLIRWVDKYKISKTIKRKSKIPIAYKLKKDEVNYIIDIIKNDKTITMKDLLYRIKQKYPDFDISRRHLSNIIKDNNITLKLTRFRHEPKTRFKKPIFINKQLKLFYNKVKLYDINDIICLDETSIKSLQKRNFCYSEKGKRCVLKTENNEVFKKYTCVFAISTKGVLGWYLYEKGGINTERLYNFLEKHIANKYKNKLIIMDNASSHRNHLIKDLINENNELLYSVPYQHYTNAIENWFSVLKSKLQKKEGLIYNKLKRNIQNSIEEIQTNTFLNIFKGSYNRTDYKIKHKQNKTKKKYL